MGSYNSQYQSYYSSLAKSRRNNPYSRGTPSSKSSNPLDKSRLMKRVFRELIGVFCLVIIVLVCKIIKTPETNSIYTYCKDIVNYNYDYNTALEGLKGLDLQEVSSKIQDYIDNAKSQITGEDSFKDKISSEFIAPVQGEIISGYGSRLDPATDSNTFHYGVDIAVSEGSEVKCSASGVVKFIGEDDILGKYITIDHGIGVETKYANLKEIKVENGDSVESGEVIALTGAGYETKTLALHFELLYMGENKNPEEYIRLTYISQ